MTVAGFRAVVIAACIFMLACGGGSGTPSNPSRPPGTVTVAAGAHVLGEAGAKVTIVEFSDFQCPYCKSFYADTEWQIVDAYVKTGKARFAYRQFPLSMHQYAEVAARASECAAKVGGNDGFWKYHDMLFTRGQGDGTGLDPASLKQYAVDLQLDAVTFNACLDNGETASAVSNDSSDGRAAGVGGTPTFFVNGHMISGAQPFSVFKDAIEGQL